MAAILVEGLDADAQGLARFLAAEGHAVRLAGPGAIAAGEARALEELGVAVEPHADLDAVPGAAEIAYLDVWTPEAAPRVAALRAQGTRVSCLGDLLLERWAGPTVGITGTAGKTSTTALVAEMLRASGVPLAVSAGARAGNLWPTADLLEQLQVTGGDVALLLELTSSHLAFMQSSPAIAGVTSFWPDHLELHGGMAAYRAAKEVIVRHQQPGDTVAVNADDAAASFTDVTPAAVVSFSLQRPVERGAYLEAGGLVLVDPGGTTLLGALPGGIAHPSNLVGAAAIAAAVGADPQAIAWALAGASALPWRRSVAGHIGGTSVIDDGMAATPRKAATGLAGHADGSIVLIAGGLLDMGTGRVHNGPEEQELLGEALDEAVRAACLVVVFGIAGELIGPELEERGGSVRVATDLDEAVQIAAANLGSAQALVFAPMFPVTLAERQRFAGIVASIA